MNAREIILNALYKIENDGAYSSKALNNALKLAEPVDKAFVTEIFYGVLKNFITLDYIIMQFSSVKLKKMSIWVKNILRMGTYQIYFTDKIPDSAACNESVKLAKKYGHQASVRFVNGVLRNISRNKENIKLPNKSDTINYLSIGYSCPKWIVEMLNNQYGAEDCEKILAESRQAHPITIRVNTLKTTSGELIDKLKSENGVGAVEDRAVKNCLVIDGGLDINTVRLYKDGCFTLQNKSSMLAAEALGAMPGEFVIDMCAAPGGKSTYIAERMQNKGKVLAFDIYEHKTELIKKSAERLGIDIIEARVHNSEIFDENLEEKADRVLVDAPCSGLGVIHRKPDIKYSRKPEDIKILSEIQSKILDTASKYVKKDGGVLVYSTCTILRQENQDVIAEFVKNHSEFEILEEKQLLTHQMGGSGFYICKMKRNLNRKTAN